MICRFSQPVAWRRRQATALKPAIAAKSRSGATPGATELRKCGG
jgi:hypothetical protein